MSAKKDSKTKAPAPAPEATTAAPSPEAAADTANMVGMLMRHARKVAGKQ